MARNISIEALLKLQQKTGSESIVVVECGWGGRDQDGTPVTSSMYADRVIPSQPHVKPAIVELSDLDSIVAISLNETSDEITLTLDDTDGTIKEIIDNNDIHLIPVVLYQWFADLPWTSKFVIFAGKINSPVVWSEGARTVSFSVVSQLEDKEVGFSPEEGNFPDLPQSMIGKTWPECFGTTVHQKGLQMDFVHRGTLGEPIGMSDFTIPHRITALNAIKNFLVTLQLLWAFMEGYLRAIKAEQAADAAHQKQVQFAQQQQSYIDQIDELVDARSEQQEFEKDSIRIIGGEEFPRGGLILEISGAYFVGAFREGAGQEDIFDISCQQHPQRHLFPHASGSLCVALSGIAGVEKTFPEAERFSVQQVTGPAFAIYTGVITGDSAGSWFAQGGAAVKIYSAEPLRYIVSITRGCGGNQGVLKVASFTTFNSGERVLVDVPANMYRVYRQSYGSVQATIVEVNDALSKQTPSWEDQIYITYQSCVGPNPIDIMKYIIGRYSDLSWDGPSFNLARARTNNYPMHFCMPARKNVVTALKELAFQARCAIFIKNNVFHIRYLPDRPTTVHTFTDSNTEIESVELGFTETEDLITKFSGVWRAHGAQDEDNKVILRYNIQKYGTHEYDFDFYAYNNVSPVIKAMTYWIIRRGHTWKLLSFRAALDAMNVEVFDGVTLDHEDDFAAYAPLLGSVEKAQYNSDTHSMDITVWTGVRAGDMVEYDFAYPGQVSTFLRFPDATATAANNDGGGGIGQRSGGAIASRGPQRYESNYDGPDDPYDIGPNITKDLGTRKPSDVGDTSPGRPTTTETGQANTGPETPATPAARNSQIVNPEFPFFIDIRTTEIVDSKNNTTSTLDTFFYEITQGKLKGDTDARWTDGDNDDKFDFKFDDEGDKWGAGTAFLQDD
jgi:hypothetical protein